MLRSDLERAYADVLFAHIDRLNDICDEDPCEHIVADLVAAFDKVARLDPRLSAMEPYLALRRGLGWVFPGDKVWGPLHAGAQRRVEMTVSMCFTGEDGDAQCVLSFHEDGKTLYRCLPLACLALEEHGPCVFEAGKLPASALHALALRLGCVPPSSDAGADASTASSLSRERAARPTRLSRRARPHTTPGESQSSSSPAPD